jgi:rubrerythrin
MKADNIEYDIITTLQNKLEGISAYDKYMTDCDRAEAGDCKKLFQMIKNDDERHVEELRKVLKQLLG